MSSDLNWKMPREGEIIYGCDHTPACSRVNEVRKHVLQRHLDHFIVIERAQSRTVRVKREEDGNLYEVELVNFNDL